MRRLSPIVYVCVCVFVCVLTSCRDQQLTIDSKAILRFSVDTISFDTVFTAMGSSTRRVMVYNPNANAVRINRVWWKNGQKFFANLDGENNPSLWNDLEMYGGDSLFLFVRVEIDPYNGNPLPLEVDTLFFEVNGNRQFIAVQAHGMNVEKIRTSQGLTTYTDAHFTADKPYLIYDTIVVQGALTIDAGASFYMHNNARIIAYGNVTALGTPLSPIRFMGDRLDYLFPQVPYRVASGQWGGLFLTDTTANGHLAKYELENIHLLSGQVGLYCFCNNNQQLSHLRLHNARIHNMAAYGVWLENINAEISNVEISNCASYGMYLCGGSHRIEQISVANYFGYPYTTLNIHSTQRQNVAAVYIKASSFNMAPSHDSIYNSIITGAINPALVLDSISTPYTAEIAGCYILSAGLPDSLAHDNKWAQDGDVVFKNTYYKYGEYIYYDFHLNTPSPARQIGLPISSLRLTDRIANDLDNQPRDANQPDAGCYSNQQ